MAYACSLERSGTRFVGIGADAGSSADHEGGAGIPPSDSGSDGIVPDATTIRDASPPPPSDAAVVSDAAVLEDAGPVGYTPPPGEVGAPCDDGSECDGFMAMCITSTGVLTGGNGVPVPNGYCVVPCAAQSPINTCGMDARCIQGANFDVCARTCTDDDDCRRSEGYVCRDDLCTLPNL